MGNMPLQKIGEGPSFQSQSMTAAQALIDAPMQALNDLPYAFGFALLEYGSDIVQTKAIEMSPLGWGRAAGALTRGVVLSTNLHYWDNGHY